MPLRKVHELTFLWFGLPGPLLISASLRKGFGGIVLLLSSLFSFISLRFLPFSFVQDSRADNGPCSKLPDQIGLTRDLCWQNRQREASPPQASHPETATTIQGAMNCGENMGRKRQFVHKMFVHNFCAP